MESKGKFRQRLTTEGRWEAFVAKREQLKAEGVEARAAWQQAALEFAPSNEPAPAEPVTAPSAAPTTEPAKRRGRRRKDPLVDRGVPPHEAVSWVADHLDATDIDRQQAPSAMAWNLLAWVKKNPVNLDQFWSSIWVKTLPTGSELKKKEKNRWVDDGSQSVLDLIEKIEKACPHAVKREPDQAPSGLAPSANGFSNN